MTEITEYNKLPPALERFVLHWGDMGSQWGVNRSVAQIQALLFLSDRPLNAEEISRTLGLARSNVSTSIKELLGWRLISRAPVRGDRRDHFVAETDIWEMAKRIAQGRKERELDPALAVLRQAAAEAGDDPRAPQAARARLGQMLEFVEATNRWYAQMMNLPVPALARLMRMGAKVAEVIGLGRKGTSAA